MTFAALKAPDQAVTCTGDTAESKRYDSQKRSDEPDLDVWFGRLPNVIGNTPLRPSAVLLAMHLAQAEAADLWRHAGNETARWQPWKPSVLAALLDLDESSVSRALDELYQLDAVELSMVGNRTKAIMLNLDGGWFRAPRYIPAELAGQTTGPRSLALAIRCAWLVARMSPTPGKASPLSLRSIAVGLECSRRTAATAVSTAQDLELISTEAREAATGRHLASDMSACWERWSGPVIAANLAGNLAQLAPLSLKTSLGTRSLRSGKDGSHPCGRAIEGEAEKPEGGEEASQSEKADQKLGDTLKLVMLALLSHQGGKLADALEDDRDPGAQRRYTESVAAILAGGWQPNEVAEAIMADLEGREPPEHLQSPAGFLAARISGIRESWNPPSTPQPIADDPADPEPATNEGRGVSVPAAPAPPSTPPTPVVADWSPSPNRLRVLNERARWIANGTFELSDFARNFDPPELEYITEEAARLYLEVSA